MQNLQKTLIEILKEDPSYFSEDKLLKNKLTEDALKLEPKLIKYILADDRLKNHFFLDIDGVLVFDKDKFIQFVNDKQFLPDSYTSFKNTIGLLDENGDYFKEKKEVVLAWPYKDCVLEGGQDKDDHKRNEVFYNEILAPDEIDRLFDPKVLTNFKRYDKDGEHPNPNDMSRNDNLIIKENNLLALHSLKKLYRGKVKLIYIDPPYKTDNDEFKYNDKFSESTWLTFMKNRLQVAKYLLCNDGILLIQISDIMVSKLRILLDEIFRAENFINKITVKTRSPSGFKTVNLGVFESAEYIFLYGKDKKLCKFNTQYVEDKYDPQYRFIITNVYENPVNWKYKNFRDDVAKHLGFDSYKDVKKKLDECIIEKEISKFALDNKEIVFRLENIGDDAGKETVKTRDISKDDPEKVYFVKRDNHDDRYILNGQEIAFYSKKVKDIDGELKPSQMLTNIWSDISWEGIAKEGGVKLKKGKKPEKLLKRIIDITNINRDKEVIMDFFLGSGTTCAVAHKMGFQYIGIEQLDYEKNDAVTRLMIS